PGAAQSSPEEPRAPHTPSGQAAGQLPEQSSSEQPANEPASNSESTGPWSHSVAPPPPPPPSYPAAPPPYPSAYPRPQQWSPVPSPGMRPGTVRAAAILTWIFAGLTCAVFIVMGVLLAVDAGPFVDAVMDRVRSSRRSLHAARPDLTAVLWGAVVVMVIWAVAACVLAWLAWRGHGWARIVLVVSSAITAVLSLLSLPSSVLNLLAAVAVIVLLFTRSANDWYAGRR